ncbi:unnamed protein product [Clonostachys rosea f. rosea IK726]|uniref:Uncharacterized protein n=1 Tax=Clonostachys rosea f. rosea IK726 TaxID=1349383 RepID=A0ACA9UTI1_BIOOC|nr:unnamed protein product [Clonostachys rosea f. rosea IK726]
MPSQSSSKQSSGGSNNSAGSGKALTHYRVVKEGWGDRPTFQASHGLKSEAQPDLHHLLDPSGIEEGNLILDGYVQAGKDAWGSGKK